MSSFAAECWKALLLSCWPFRSTQRIIIVRTNNAILCQCIFRASFPYISMYSQSDACKPTIVMQRVYGWRWISMAFLPEMVVERSSTGFRFFNLLCIGRYLIQINAYLSRVFVCWRFFQCSRRVPALFFGLKCENHAHVEHTPTRF